jgi:hypothetical protein
MIDELIHDLQVTEHSKHSDGRPIKIGIDTINTSVSNLLNKLKRLSL